MRLELLQPYLNLSSRNSSWRQRDCSKFRSRVIIYVFIYGPSSWRMLYGLDMNSDKGILLAADNFGLLYMMSTPRSSRALTSQASASIRRVVSDGYPTGSG
ncbi:uncharacterized protein LOC131009051 isoform X1 [Salvia miltiorrhiza]|uniref:uncharacterized protein LOC131009051 isoform X1 n=1 Tax=Salvia miltiorrhiza TaxID=226208 RepID=UPI0025ACB35F|nr:uncharacterized protein LOC131009051 isoform X1 [Salvia miltiorrhiza]